MPYDDRLFALLRELDDSELTAVWTQALRCAPEHEDFAAGSREFRIANISKEWRSVHGHSLLNLRRGSHELPWRRILIDVADKLKPGWGWSHYTFEGEHSDEEIEAAILSYFDERAKAAWDAMSEKERMVLAEDLDRQLKRARSTVQAATIRASTVHVSVASLGTGIAAGLVGGTGAIAVAQGTAGLALGGLLGNVMYQLGFAIVVRVFGWWSGVQLAAGGGAATVAGAVLSVPAGIALAANAVMSTSYRKSIPAMLMVLTAHELRRQLSQMEMPK